MGWFKSLLGTENESGPFLLRKSKIQSHWTLKKPCRQEITFINSLTLFDLFLITTNTI